MIKAEEHLKLCLKKANLPVIFQIVIILNPQKNIREHALLPL